MRIAEGMQNNYLIQGNFSMDSFLKNVIVFIAIPIIGLVLIEWKLYSLEGSFHTKYNFIEQNKENIEVLILGSSHNKTAINPKYLDYKAANLAFGEQDLKLDSFLLSKYLSSLKNLKYVCLELSYHSLEHRETENYHGNVLYYRYYDIDNFDNKDFSISNYSIFLSAPNLYIKFLNPFYAENVNEFGFRTSLKKDGQFYQFNYDSIVINSRDNDKLIKRHKYRNIRHLEKNMKTFRAMINAIIAQNAIPIIISPPVYNTYYRNMLPDKKAKRDIFINQLIKEYPKLVVLNFENSNLFHIKHFINDDHLNIIGAKKFSKILNEELLKLEYKKEH